MPEFIKFSEFFRTHSDDFDAILFDVDGTLASGSVPLPGTGEFLSYLESIKFPYFLLTNDSCNSRAQKARYLAKGGIPVTEERVLSAGNAFEWWVKQGNYDGSLFFQYGKLGNPSYVEAAGIKVTTDPERIYECGGVLCGEGVYDWQPAIEAAFNLLYKHPEYPLIVANPDSYWPSLRVNGWGIGAGAVARFICQVLADAGKEVKPFYLGKPYPPIYQCVFPFLKRLFPEKEFNDPTRILMIGDSLKSDILGANTNGMSSALVLSGVTTMEHVEKAPQNEQPEFIFSGI